jgi:hypothetical protein
MPRPTSATTLQRPDLGTLAYEYLIDGPNRGFIGLDVMPIFEVPEQSADYPKIPIEALLKDKDTKRAPRGTYNRGDWEFETGTYKAEEYGWEEPVDDVEAALYRRYFDAEMIATEICVDTILRGHEKRVIAALEANNLTSGVGTEWNTLATATPRANVETGREAMRGHEDRGRASRDRDATGAGELPPPPWQRSIRLAQEVKSVESLDAGHIIRRLQYLVRGRAVFGIINLLDSRTLPVEKSRGRPAQHDVFIRIVVVR